jgi:hypothetical protein
MKTKLTKEVLFSFLKNNNNIEEKRENGIW